MNQDIGILHCWESADLFGEDKASDELFEAVKKIEQKYKKIIWYKAGYVNSSLTDKFIKEGYFKENK